MKRVEELKKRVLDQLFWDDRVDASRIEVAVHDRQVMLEGHAPSYWAAQAAVEDTRMVEGVVDVVNRISVDTPAEVGQPTDEQIATSIKTILDATASLDTSDLEIHVKEGEVTLRGSVDTYWKKTRVELMAGEVVGVRRLVNLLAVVPGNRQEDEEVARAVYGALARNPGVEAGAVGVRVNAGKVTLSGVVPDWNAYRAARDAAEFTPGVTDLENELIIE